MATQGTNLPGERLVPSTLKYFIFNDDEYNEKPHERVEDRPAQSRKISISENQQKTGRKNPPKETGASLS